MDPRFKVWGNKLHLLMGRTAKSHCSRYGYRECVNGGHQLWMSSSLCSYIFGGSLALCCPRMTSAGTTGVCSTFSCSSAVLFSRRSRDPREDLKGLSLLMPRDGTGTSSLCHILLAKASYRVLSTECLCPPPNSYDET